MAGPSQNVRIEELHGLVKNLVTRLDSIHAELKRESDRHESELARQTERREAIAKSLEDVQIKVAVLTRDVGELQKSKDEWGRRIWGLVQTLTGVVIGASLVYYFKR